MLRRLLCRVMKQRDLGTRTFAPRRQVDRRALSFIGCSRGPSLRHMEAITLSGAQEGVEDGGAGLACDGHARNDDCLPEGSVEEGCGDVGVGARDCERSSKHKKPRRRWTFSDDLLGVKAVVAMSAHVAPYGERTRRFLSAAEAFNAHPQASFQTDGKHLRDRFVLLAKNFSAKDKTEARRTGQEEDVSELTKILIDVVDNMEDYERRAVQGRNEEKAKEAKLVADGETIRRLAVERRRERSNGAASSSGGKDNQAKDTVNHAGSSPGGRPSSAGSSRRRRRVDDDDDELLAVLERSEQRRMEMFTKNAEMQERQWEQDRKDRADEVARQVARDAEARAERAAHVRLMDALVRKLL